MNNIMIVIGLVIAVIEIFALQQIFSAPEKSKAITVLGVVVCLFIIFWAALYAWICCIMKNDYVLLIDFTCIFSPMAILPCGIAIILSAIREIRPKIKIKETKVPKRVHLYDKLIGCRDFSKEPLQK